MVPSRAVFNANFDSSQPIGEQLIQEFSRRIAVGSWGPGMKIPSVRNLAVDLGVNPNTVQKALSVLTERGLLVAVSTSGRFVTQDQALIDAAFEQLARASVSAFVNQMQALRASEARTLALVRREWAEQAAELAAAQAADSAAAHS